MDIVDEAFQNVTNADSVLVRGDDVDPEEEVAEGFLNCNIFVEQSKEQMKSDSFLRITNSLQVVDFKTNKNAQDKFFHRMLTFGVKTNIY
eukprot:11068118-Ditylum_brightwellii.AAC.1